MSQFFSSGGQSIGVSTSASVLQMNIQDYFGIDWLDLFAVQGTLESLVCHHSSKASILPCSALFIVQLSHPYMTTGKTIALPRWTLVINISFFKKITINTIAVTTYICCLQSYLMQSLSHCVGQWPHPRSSLWTLARSPFLWYHRNCFHASQRVDTFVSWTWRRLTYSQVLPNPSWIASGFHSSNQRCLNLAHKLLPSIFCFSFPGPSPYQNFLFPPSVRKPEFPHPWERERERERELGFGCGRETWKERGVICTNSCQPKMQEYCWSYY